jgi:hypothetical protein
VRRRAANVVDFLLALLAVYAANVTSSGIILYADRLIRLQLLGLAPGMDLSQNRAQIIQHPAIIGRPRLTAVLWMVSFTGILLTYFSLSRSVCRDRTPGAILAGVSGKSGTEPAFAIRVLVHELMQRAEKTIRDWLMDRLRISEVRELIGKLRELASPVSMLPRGLRLIGWFTIAFVLILSISMPVLSDRRAIGGYLTFPSPNGGSAEISYFSLYFALGALAIGWAAALTGAVAMNPIAALVAGLFYIFTMSPLGLSGGRAWWATAPQWAVLGIAALSSSESRWRLPVLWTLCIIAVFHTARMTPLAPMVKNTSWAFLTSWRCVTVIASALMIVLARFGVGLSARWAFAILSFIDVLYGAIAIARSGEAAVAGQIYYSISILMSFLVTFWFLLGANVVRPVVAAAGAFVKTARRSVSARWLPNFVVFLCLVELFFISQLEQRYPRLLLAPDRYTLTIPAHEGVAILLLLLAAVLTSMQALNARRALWLLALWSFSLGMLIVYFGLALKIRAGMPEATPREALSNVSEFGAFVLLAGGIVFEAFIGHRRVAGENALSDSSNVLLIYLGALTLFTALTHLNTVSRTYPPDAAAAYSYIGMQMLWPAVAGLAAIFTIGRMRGSRKRTIMRAVLIGASLSFLPDLIRRDFGDPANLGYVRNVVVLSIAELEVFAFTIWLASRTDDLSVLDSAFASVACALGFAVAYTAELTPPLLTTFVGVPSHMLGFKAGALLADRWLQYLPFGPHGNPIPTADVAIFYILLPSMAAVAGVTLRAAILRRKFMPAATVVPGLIGVAAFLALPLYSNPVLIKSLGHQEHVSAAQMALTHGVFVNAVAYLRHSRRTRSGLCSDAVAALFALADASIASHMKRPQTPTPLQRTPEQFAEESPNEIEQ